MARDVARSAVEAALLAAAAAGTTAVSNVADDSASSGSGGAAAPAPVAVAAVAAAAGGGSGGDISEAALVLGACQALAVIDGSVVGDPLERAGMAGADWALAGPDQSASRGLPRRGARVLSRHLFSSELRRMSVVCKTDGFAAGAYWCLAKGAPEAMVGRCKLILLKPR